MSTIEQQAAPDTGVARLRLPGFGSLKGRYFYIAGLLILLLVLAAAAGRMYVEWTTRITFDKIQERSRVNGALEDVIRQLVLVDEETERFILLPQGPDRQNLEQAVEQLSVSLLRLGDLDWRGSEQSTQAILRMLRSDSDHLREKIDELIRTRLDVNLWFPVSVIMEQELLPRTSDFMASVNAVLGELEVLPVDVATTAVYRTAVELRHDWTRMTAEFRLYIANRLGVFSTNALEGMADRAANIRMHSERVTVLLNRLQGQTARDHAGGVSEELVDALREHHAAWMEGYRRIAGDLNRDGWRRDMVLLNSQIVPLIQSLRQQLASLEMELDVESAGDIVLLNRTAQRLSDVFLLLALVGTGLVVAGYLMFSRSLLHPMAQLTTALKAQALGQPHGPLPPPNADETRDLLQAFHWMRQQVSARHSQLDHLAHHDALTGLPNRLLFRDRLEHALRIAERARSQVAVLFVDLDRFKQINDTMGHMAGDVVLVEVANRLGRTLRSADTVARFSGDEFAVLMESIENRDEVTVVVEKVLAALDQPFRLEGREVSVSASIGIALGPLDDREAGALLRNADAAMYDAKRHGRKGFRYYSHSITERAVAFMDLERELRKALASDEFPFLFQPVATADGSRIQSFEVLLRWHRETTAVAPERFLSVLEETGLILAVAERALEKISDLQRSLRQEDLAEVGFSIDVSPRLLKSGELSDRILAHVRRGAITARHLLLEVSEDTLIRDPAVAERELHRLRDQGVRIVLDRFGTGQSSINLLHRFPFDAVKIDPQFLADVPKDSRDSVMVKGIIGLAHVFAMSVTAEGVERAEQLDFLRRSGCDLVQGHHLSGPLSAAGLLSFLRRWQGRGVSGRRSTVTRLNPLRGPDTKS